MTRGVAVSSLAVAIGWRSASQSTGREGSQRVGRRGGGGGALFAVVPGETGRPRPHLSVGLPHLSSPALGDSAPCRIDDHQRIRRSRAWRANRAHGVRCSACRPDRTAHHHAAFGSRGQRACCSRSLHSRRWSGSRRPGRHRRQQPVDIRPLLVQPPCHRVCRPSFHPADGASTGGMAVTLGRPRITYRRRSLDPFFDRRLLDTRRLSCRRLSRDRQWRRRNKSAVIRHVTSFDGQTHHATPRPIHSRTRSLLDGTRLWRGSRAHRGSTALRVRGDEPRLRSRP